MRLGKTSADNRYFNKRTTLSYLLSLWRRFPLRCELPYKILGENHQLGGSGGSPPLNLTSRAPDNSLITRPITPLALATVTSSSITPASLSLPIRTPPTAERPRQRRHLSLETSPASLYELPASTAPAKLGRSKRKRVHTARYKESKASGLIPESQEAHKGDGEM